MLHVQTLGTLKQPAFLSCTPAYTLDLVLHYLVMLFQKHSVLCRRLILDDVNCQLDSYVDAFYVLVGERHIKELTRYGLILLILKLREARRQGFPIDLI
jgi:hypothetical protein